MREILEHLGLVLRDPDGELPPNDLHDLLATRVDGAKDRMREVDQDFVTRPVGGVAASKGDVLHTPEVRLVRTGELVGAAVKHELSVLAVVFQVVSYPLVHLPQGDRKHDLEDRLGELFGVNMASIEEVGEIPSGESRNLDVGHLRIGHHDLDHSLQPRVGEDVETLALVWIEQTALEELADRHAHGAELESNAFTPEADQLLGPAQTQTIVGRAGQILDQPVLFARLVDDDRVVRLARRDVAR